MKALLCGDGLERTTLIMKGNLTIGGDNVPIGCVPTPRFTGENCYLAPRQHAYTMSEIALHSQGLEPIVPRAFSFMCRCGSRLTERKPGTLVRLCHECGCTYAWRVTAEGFIPMAPLTAAAWDERMPRGCFVEAVK